MVSSVLMVNVARSTGYILLFQSMEFFLYNKVTNNLPKYFLVKCLFTLKVITSLSSFFPVVLLYIFSSEFKGILQALGGKFSKAGTKQKMLLILLIALYLVFIAVLHYKVFLLYLIFFQQYLLILFRNQKQNEILYFFCQKRNKMQFELFPQQKKPQP